MGKSLRVGSGSEHSKVACQLPLCPKMERKPQTVARHLPLMLQNNLLCHVHVGVRLKLQTKENLKCSGARKPAPLF